MGRSGLRSPRDLRSPSALAGEWSVRFDFVAMAADAGEHVDGVHSHAPLGPDDYWPELAGSGGSTTTRRRTGGGAYFL